MMYPLNNSEKLAAAYMLHRGMVPVRRGRGSDFALPDGTLLEVKSAKQLFSRNQCRDIATTFNDGGEFVLLLTTSDTVMRFELSDLAKRDHWPYDERKVMSPDAIAQSPWSMWDVGYFSDRLPPFRVPRPEEFELEGYQW